jgi:16S rRNA (guanine527-N7)-methyltransferase
LSTPRPELLAALSDAQSQGFLGPGDPRAHLDHALAFAGAAETAFDGAPPRAFLDLGSGGGVPGLVLAVRWRDATGLLVDAAERRCRFLLEMVRRLGLEAHVEVRRGRAEVLAHEPALRASFPLVVARSFGPPAVTAELAAGFLAVGGWLVVSEPPEPDEARWSPEGLHALGYGPAVRTRSGGAAFVVIPKRHDTPDNRPRRTGIPAKRPLW